MNTASPELVAAAQSTRTEAEARASRIARAVTQADSLKWIAKAEGDVYLNIGRGQEAKCISSGRNPAFWRSLDMFSGELGQATAKEDAEALRDSYLTTIVLHPDGTWSEQYLFRL